MARRTKLDPKILEKIATKRGQPGNVKSVREAVSRLAHKQGISSEAALVLLAKRYSIGTSTYQRNLDPTKQSEIRDALPAVFTPMPTANSSRTKSKTRANKSTVVSKRDSLKFTIEYLIQDNELRSRCQDLLLASSKFDRAINQATLVLEDRIRKKANPPKKLVGENLVNYAFNEDITKTILAVVKYDADDQRGFTQMLRGIVAAFRNKTHHHITDFSREDALRICGYIDVLIRVVDNSKEVE